MDRLLYMPGNSFSPSTVGYLPNERRALEVLRDHFEVDIFHHPWLKGGPPVKPSWQAYVELIRSQLTSGCHVLARPLSSPFVMLALDGNDRVASFISMGFSPPRATLIALDLKVLADARDAATTQPLYQFAMYIKSSAADEELSDLTAMLEAEMDREKEDAFDRSLESVEIVAQAPRVLIPTLYLDPSVQMVAMSDTTDLFLRLVPQTVVANLEDWAERSNDGSGGEELAARIIDFTNSLGGGNELVTVLLVDIVDSTKRAIASGQHAWSEKLDAFNRGVRQETARYAGREIDNAGDGFLLAFSSPSQALRCAAAIRSALVASDLPVRIGINTGECQSVGGKLSGLPIHIASRIAQLAAPNEILVSHTVHGLLVGSSFAFEARGHHELKGVPGSWALYAAQPAGQ